MNSPVIWPYVLRRGHSGDPSHGACAMDAINWLVHGRHGDAPVCACPLITKYVILGNDAMPDDTRQRLLPYLHRIAGSRSRYHQPARIRALQLGALRVCAAHALDVVGLRESAANLRNLPDDIDMAEVRTIAAAVKSLIRDWEYGSRHYYGARKAAVESVWAVAEIGRLAAAARREMWAAEETAQLTARAAAVADAWDDYSRSSTRR